MLQSQPFSALFITMTQNHPDKPTPHISLHEFWPYQAVVLANEIGRYTLSVVKQEAQLNLSQWRVLAAIGEKSGRTAAEVTSLTPMDKTIVSRAVNALLRDGYIEKAQDMQDKRRLSLSTTKKGEQVYQKTAKILNETLIKALGASFNPEKFVEDLKTYTDIVTQLSPDETA